MSLRTRLLGHLRTRLVTAVPLRVVFWDGEMFDFAPSPTVTLNLRSRRLARALLRGDMDRLVAAYVSGEITVEGRLSEVLQVGVAIAEQIGRWPMLRTLAALRPRRRHSRARDIANIRYHYDVSNAFYGLWLDRHMVYSCAYFSSGREQLDAAQEQKLDHLCRKLRLRPGDRLLDIGCGWGGLACWAAERYRANVLGITLSQKQVEEARRRIAAAGLTGQVEVRYEDYRDVQGQGAFDKIVSVGMYEHVGLRNLPTYFAAIARLLKPGGVLLNQGITSNDRDSRPRGPPGGSFIDRYVFPGGELPHISRVLYEISGASLEPIDWEDLRPHYARTLACWVARLEARRAEVVAAAGVERYRIWRMYLAGMRYAFDHGWLSVGQVLAIRPDAAGPAQRPWTRQYQYARPPSRRRSVSRSPVDLWAC